eukprot:gi/632959598/ref/XP_007895711.1/ PREDICTED: band 4.1-like protein 4B [Callorhinchus milii]
MCFKQVEIESNKMVGQWPSLHINMNNKGDEKKLSEKGLHPPTSPLSLPDQMKSNILKAQMDAALKVGAEVVKEDPELANHSKCSSVHADAVRCAAPLQDGTAVSGVQEKQRPKAPRLRKLIRQYSFNHSDEDDLPPALAAATRSSPPPASKPPSFEIPQLHAPIYCKNSFDQDHPDLAAPGDLLMDFTEATPLIKTVPANAFSSAPQFPVELTDSLLQCYDLPPSPGKPSSVIPLHVVRPLTDPSKSSSATCVHAAGPLIDPGKSSLMPLHAVRPLNDPGISSSVMPLHAVRPLTDPGKSSARPLHAMRHLTDPGKSSVMPLHAVRYPSDPGKSSVMPLHVVRPLTDPRKTSITPLHAVRPLTDPGVSSSVTPLHAIRYPSDPIPPVQHTTSPTDR